MKKNEKEKNFIFRLFPYLRPYSRRVFYILLLMLISSGLNVLPVIFFMNAFDNYFLGEDSTKLALFCVGVVFYGFLLALHGYYQRIASQKLGHLVIKDLKDDLFESVHHKSFSFFDKNSTGNLISRIMSDTERLRNFMAGGLVNFVVNIFILSGVILVLFLQDPIFGFIFLGLFPFLFGGTWFFTKKILPSNKLSRTANQNLTRSIHETFNGIREVKLYGREEYLYNTFKKWNDEYFDAVIESNRYNSIYGPYIPFILNVCKLTFIFIATSFIIQEGETQTVTIGFIITMIAYFGIFSGPIKGVLSYANQYSWAKVSAERVFEIFDHETEIEDVENPIVLSFEEGSDFAGKITFENVHFEYDENNGILHDINLTINPGENVALVGPSGVGKTTLAHLVPRFYEVKKGTVSIDGVNIKDIQLHSLRKEIGMVFQNIFLFDGTIVDNIIYGKEDATKEEVFRAIKISQLHNFIKSLPNGAQTPIGERGVKISGGQAQRMALARVLVTDPKLLIMDEPTSNIDAITDKKLMDAVRLVMKGRTTLVIAHRLWTIKNADKIVLLKDGKIQGIGTHNELLRENSFYQEFFESQFTEKERMEVEGQ